MSLRKIKIGKKFVAVLFLLLAVGFALPNASHEKAQASETVSVWWPSANANLSGAQPFKAMLNNWTIENYNMFWQVDNGQYNVMYNNYTDYPHKEVTVDVSGWHWSATGNYNLNFVAQDRSGRTIAQQSVSVIINPPALPTVPAIVTPVAQPVPATPTPVTQTPVPTTAVTNMNMSIFSNAKLYVNPNTDPKKWADANRYSRPTDAALMDKIANQAETQWFGDWNSNVYNDVNNNVTTIANSGALPVMVAYNIPLRDCGSYSAGGAKSADAYKTWINSFASAIGNRKAVVLVEPDGLASMDCLSSTDKQIRMDLIKYAVQTFKAQGNTAVYIDAGNANWISANDMAARLKSAGIDQANGFVLNISNFISTQDNTNYGTKLSALVGNKHFIIDTGRNGSGPTSDFQWCNPSGRSLGARPTTNTGNPLIDAYLWVKGPGGSDGQCNGGPAAGVFWPEYALGLAQRTSW